MNSSLLKMSIFLLCISLSGLMAQATNDPMPDNAIVQNSEPGTADLTPSQDRNNTPLSSPRSNKFYLGLKAGYGASLVKKQSSADKPYWLNSINIMFTGEYRFSRSFGLFFEVGYLHGLLTNVFVVDSKASGGGYVTKHSLSVVQFNVGPRFIFPEIAGKLNIFAGIGLDTGFLSYYIDVPGVNFLVNNGVETATVTTPTGNFHGTGFALGATANIGARYYLDKDVDLVFIAKFDYNFYSRLSWEVINKTTDLTHMELTVTIGPVMKF